MSVLDVGSGTGVAARIAAETAGSVIALDPSARMLQMARSKGIARIVQGSVPGLPFRESTLDRVMASFVISHLPSYEAALADMVRVLSRGGRLGVTAWGIQGNEVREYWQSLVEAVAGKEALAKVNEQGLPWEDWFADPAHVDRALAGAGLRNVQVHRFVYETRIATADFLALRENSMQARFLRQTWSETEWLRFTEYVTEQFSQRFTDPLVYLREVYVAVGDSL